MGKSSGAVRPGVDRLSYPFHDRPELVTDGGVSIGW